MSIVCPRIEFFVSVRYTKDNESLYEGGMFGIATWVILVVLAAVVFVVVLLVTSSVRIASGQQWTGADRLIHSIIRDLTEAARAGRLDPVVGRSEELAQLVHILSRRRRNHALLVGEHGVGKTALLDGLSILIAEHAAPHELANARVVQWNIDTFLAATSLGSDNSALKRLWNRSVSVREPMVLFLDDVHRLFAHPEHPHAHILRSLLASYSAQANLRIVAATTPEDYRRVMDKHDALGSMFQIVEVREPTAEQTYDILEVQKRRYEEYHGVEFKPSALKAAVELGKHTVAHIAFPQSALDVLDETATYAKLHHDIRKSGGAIPPLTKHDVEAAFQEYQARDVLTHF